MKPLLLRLAALLLLCPAAQAQDALITSTTITSSTSGSDLWAAEHLLDGSGLSGTPTLAALGTHAAAAGANAWATTAHAPDYFAPPKAPPAPVLTCALPQLSAVTELVVWGYHSGAPNAGEGKSFVVTFSTDGANYRDAETVSTPGMLQSAAARLAFPGGAHLATHVKVTVTDNRHDGAASGGDRVGLGELRFTGRPPLVVTNTNDSSAGSLRQAVLSAASNPGADTITFDPELSGMTIALTGPENGHAMIISDPAGITVDAATLAGGLTIEGAGPDGNFGLIKVGNGGSLTLRGLTLAKGGSGVLPGGAIYNSGGTVDLIQCTLSSNRASAGGAIANSGTGMLTQCTLSCNNADQGGAIRNYAGALTLTQCTFAVNEATYGGAIENHDGAMTLTGCTLSGNNARYAGAIYLDSGTLMLTQSTLSNNSADYGGAITNYDGTLTLTNSIVAMNTALDGTEILNSSTATLSGANLVGEISNGGSVIGSGTNRTVDPLLAPLGNYGGPTQTMALLPGSPARNTAAVLSPPVASDQRGFPIVGTPDIGAYEAGTLAPDYNAYIWESLPATATTSQRAATFDFDSDGASNTQEWAALTDPASAASVFRIASAVRSGEDLLISFPSVTGKTYTLWQSDALGTWTNTGLHAFSGNDAIRNFTLPAPVNDAPRRFYRVRAD